MKIPFLAIIVILLMAGCSHLLQPGDKYPSISEQGIVGNQAILAEALRITSLVDEKQAIPEDVDKLEQMVKDNEVALQEVHGIKAMVGYREFKHADHSIGLLVSYLERGKELVCPGHALSHYYIYLNHGDSTRANQSLAEARETLPAWIEQAKKYNITRPEEDFNSTRALIQTHLAAIDAGNSSATEDGISALSDAFCAG